MTDLLALAIGLPAVAFGVLFQNGPEVVLGLIALGMALVSLFIKSWRRNREVIYGERRA